MSGVVILVQARMSSARLPGKVMRPLADAPAIVRMMERVSRVGRAHKRIVVTSTDPSDDALAATLKDEGLDCFRGSLDDVLGRFVSACPSSCNIVVRLTGDCPLIDPETVDRHIARFLNERAQVDYLSNAVKRTQPDGLDVEVFSRDILLTAAGEGTAPGDREHVTPWIIRNARTASFTQNVDLSAMRWTLDTHEDYVNIAAIYDALYRPRPNFDSSDIYRLLLEQPTLIRIAGRAELTRSETEVWTKRIAEHLGENQ